MTMAEVGVDKEKNAMETTPHQESKDLPSPPIDDWLSLLVLLQKLQTRLAEDRQSWAETGSDMAFLVEALRLEILKLQALESHVDQEMRRQLIAIVSNAFENTIQKFKGWSLGLILILCVLSSISGGCIVYLLVGN